MSLPNRRALLGVLEEQLEFADERPFGFALIDLDHFKAINDSHGHAVGDKVLQQVAGIMRDSASDDCFFARIGGEEFGLVAVGSAVDNMAIICERLRLAILRNVMTDNDGGHFNVTASIGIARISERCSSSMAMQAADGPLRGILGYEERPLVSIDYRTDPRSSIIDALSTMVINQTQVKLYAWYDNEWGYANRAVELARLVGQYR
mgnify:CR=1 FL=1